MNTVNQHSRKSIRLKEYDYSQPGEYFITICTHNHECTLGEIVIGEMQLNEIGKIAEKCRKEIPHHFINVKLDEFIIMPNHLHGILIINEPDEFIQSNKKYQCRGSKFRTPTTKHISTHCTKIVGVNCSFV